MRRTFPLAWGRCCPIAAGGSLLDGATVGPPDCEIGADICFGALIVGRPPFRFVRREIPLPSFSDIFKDCVIECCSGS